MPWLSFPFAPRWRRAFAVLASVLGAWGSFGADEPVTLRWADNSDNEAGFKIERAVGSGPFEQIGLVGANVVEFVDTTAEEGSEYRYRVRAFNYIGHSGYTNTASRLALRIAMPELSGPAEIALGANESAASFELRSVGLLSGTDHHVWRIESSHPDRVPVESVRLTENGGGRRVDIELLPGALGQSTVTVSATDQSGETIASASVRVSRSGTIAIEAQPRDRAVAAAGLTVLSVTASGPDLSYQWYRGERGDRSAPLTGQSGPTMAVLARYEPENYWVEVSNLTESVFSETATVVAIPASQLYLGSVWGTDGSFGLLQTGPRKAEMFVYVPKLGVGFANPSVALSQSGRFSFETAELGWVVGRIEEGIVMGYIVGAKATFSGQASLTEGPQADAAGLYEGAFAGGWLSVLLGANGEAFAMVQGIGSVYGMIAAEGGGAVQISSGGDRAFALQWDATAGNLTGSLGNAEEGIFESFALRRREKPLERSLDSIAVRASCGPGERSLITGFVLAGSGSKQVLLRGIGPSMAGQGVAAPLMDPTLSVYQMGGPDGYSVAGTNDNWSAVSDVTDLELMMAEVGAFPLKRGSLDSALGLSLSGGVYAIQLTAEKVGTALAEIYDVDARSQDDRSGSRLSHFSTRSLLGSGEDSIIASFVLGGSSPKRFLFRAVGPELSAQGVSDYAKDPRLAVYGSAGRLASNDDWHSLGDLVSVAGGQVGAMPFEKGSQSAGMVIWLEPGIYGVVADSAGAPGIGLIEVYELP